MKRVLILPIAVMAWTILPMVPAHAEAGHDDEYELLQLINNDRAANGLPAVQMDGRIQADARGWAPHLLKVAFEHDPNTPWYDCSLRSENVAYGQRTVAQVHSDFMNSPDHRANILRNGVNAAGIGIYYASNGTMYTVERFYICPSVEAAQFTSGAIKAKWLALGAQPSYGRFQATPADICGGGQYQVFGGGADGGIQSSAIYWNPSVDGGKAHVTYGPIWDRWGALGYQCGSLKWPTGDPFSISYCRAALNPTAQGFQGGIVEYSAATGAHALVPGAIYNRFAAASGHCGVTGLPTSEVADWPGAETTWRYQTFENRYIAEYKPTGKAYICTYQGACT